MPVLDSAGHPAESVTREDTISLTSPFPLRHPLLVRHPQEGFYQHPVQKYNKDM